MDFTELKDLDYNSRSRHPWERARLRIIMHFLRPVIRKAQKPDPVILDIGSGDAFVAFHIATTFPGCEVHAVDTAFNVHTKEAIREKTGRAGLFLHDSLDTLSLASGRKADVILLLDVIEHIDDDMGFLSTLISHPFISRDTRILVTAPAFPCLLSSHDKFLKHYRRYTRKSLIRALQQSNLESLKSGYFFIVLLFPRIIRLYLEKLKLVKPADKGIGQWKKSKIISWLVVLILMTDYCIGRIFSYTGIHIPGLSVYALCLPVV